MGHPKPIRELVNKTGTLTASGLFNFDVFFDLLELPDPTDGVEGKLHTYGRLTFPQKLEPVLEKVLLSASRLTLKGSGIEVSIFLHDAIPLAWSDQLRMCQRKPHRRMFGDSDVGMHPRQSFGGKDY